MITLFSLLPSPFSLNITNAATLDEIVEQIQKRYAEIQDIRGTFFQTSYIKDLDRIEKYKGRFFIKKPSKIRWEYAGSRDEEVIINGSVAWIYKKSQKQVLKSRFTKGTYTHIPIALLGSLQDLKAEFEVTITEEDTLELKPKQQMSSIKKIFLKTISKDPLIKMFTIFDTYGNRVVIELKDVEINPGLDDSLFIFKVPPGVEIFDLNP
jgi:outer membrane lipoprotein carrier protein